WLEVSGAKNLAELRAKTPGELTALADKLRREHASTEALNSNISISCFVTTSSSILFSSPASTWRRWFDGDMLPDWLLRFAGGKNSNYTGEVLEMLQGLNKEWPDEVRDFVRYHCWLINQTIKSDGILPVDEGQEHNIKDIKVTHRSQGPKVDWDYLKKLHPSINVIR
ncbi:hypothetical protein B0H14DRAFT_2158456, partial [Mycena olivaceomarginata]